MQLVACHLSLKNVCNGGEALKKIGIISDTHGIWDDRYERYLSAVDEICHAGDIGTMEVAERLSALRPLRAVCGNIDGSDLRMVYPELLRFPCEGVEVLLKHIGGYPGHYDRSIASRLRENPPDLFVCGHSHILRVQYDHQLQMLHINPGAAGPIGWQAVRTLVRLTIDGKDFKDLEVIELS